MLPGTCYVPDVLVVCSLSVIKYCGFDLQHILTSLLLTCVVDCFLPPIPSKIPRHRHTGEVICEASALLCETSQRQECMLLPLPRGVGHAERRN